MRKKQTQFLAAAEEVGRGRPTHEGPKRAKRTQFGPRARKWARAGGSRRPARGRLCETKPISKAAPFLRCRRHHPVSGAARSSKRDQSATECRPSRRGRNSGIGLVQYRPSGDSSPAHGRGGTGKLVCPWGLGWSRPAEGAPPKRVWRCHPSRVLPGIEPGPGIGYCIAGTLWYNWVQRRLTRKHLHISVRHHTLHTVSYRPGLRGITRYGRGEKHIFDSVWLWGVTPVEIACLAKRR
jgi:hypothetical protein